MTWAIPGHQSQLHKKGIVTSGVEPKSLHFNQPQRHNSLGTSHKPSRILPLKGFIRCAAKSLHNLCHFLTGISSPHPPPWSPIVSGLPNVYCMATHSNTTWIPALLAPRSWPKSLFPELIPDAKLLYYISAEGFRSVRFLSQLNVKLLEGRAHITPLGLALGSVQLRFQEQ